MKIDNKFSIKDNVQFGSYDAKVLEIVIDDTGILYKISYFNGNGDYVICSVYDFEITKNDSQKLGFKK